jgi:hypothetical protein
MSLDVEVEMVEGIVEWSGDDKSEKKEGRLLS